jgi:hypothetical protein
MRHAIIGHALRECSEREADAAAAAGFDCRVAEPVNS